MAFCGNCGSSMAAGAAFCGECGRATNEPFADPNVRAAPPDALTTVLPKIIEATPPPPSMAPSPTPPPVASPITTVVGKLPDPDVVEPRVQATEPGRGGLMIAIAILGVCAVGLGIYLVNNSKDSSEDSPGSTIFGQTTLVSDTSPGETAASTIPVDPVAAATEQLSALVAQDRPTADTLVGSWVVQLSAKRVGLQADGITYGPVEILADHTNLRTTYGAIIVDGGAFQFKSGGNPMTGWFLTMVPQVYGSKAEALQWCTDHGLGSNLCLAREFKPPNP